MMRLFRRLLLPAALLAAGLFIWGNQELRQRLLRLLGAGGAEADELVPAGAELGAAATALSTPRTITSSRSIEDTAASGSAQSGAQSAPPAPRPVELASRPDPDAGQLDAYGDDETTNDRVLSRIGRYLQAEGLGRLNVNTQAGGVVFLRGEVRSQAQIDAIWSIVAETDGVGDIVNELQIVGE